MERLRTKGDDYYDLHMIPLKTPNFNQMKRMIKR